MDWIEVAGHTGAALSSITFIPQVWQAWQTKSVNDLSIYMILIVISSTVVWLIYGVTLVLWPVILANVFVMILSIILLYFKFSFKN
jgi:MtN3 and saliva related transmembrane protein